jgi:FAD dependent oxidoreductase TIGR03364
MNTHDVAVVGAGIVGLAHALAAARQGLRVVVVDRDAQANGASVRNFGFVTVTGQQAGATWRRAMRSRDVWAEVAPQAGIAVLHSGLWFAARRPEAMAVLEAFAAGPMGEGCRMLPPPAPLGQSILGALYSPHELRVEPRTAIPALAAWLEAAHGVEFRRGVAVLDAAPGRLQTTGGTIEAGRVVVCPGTDLVQLFPGAIAQRKTTLCKLHMLRLADPGWRLPGAVMSDLGLVRYLGYAPTPDLRARLEAEQPEHLANGVHLIVVQSADGSLVVGDSHHYAATPDPFQPDHVDALILDEARAVLDLPADLPVTERWIGVYPSGQEACFRETIAPGLDLVMVTSGTGMSTSFALAEETFA